MAQRNLVLIGPPGAGKGTQAKILSVRLEIPHISTGDMLRTAVRERSPIGQKASSIMEKGLLVPDEVMAGIVEERLLKADTSNGFILDGYPRTLGQAETLDGIMQKANRDDLVVINIEIEDEPIIKRLTGRRMCANCQAIFHLATNPPKKTSICDLCGGTLIQREDDRESIIRKRLTIYREITHPLIEYYNSFNRLRTVDGSDGMPEIQERILACL